MAKIDKSQYSKEEWRKIKKHRRIEKEASRKLKEQSKKELITPTETINHIPPLNKSVVGFVLGNGTSRKDISLTEISSRGTVYGCNALYREFEPDYLVAVDTKMIIEINKSGYQKTHEVWTNPNKAYASFSGFNYFQPSKGWSSGPTALWLASQHRYEQIFILGFDYKGLQDGKKVNNIYAGTQNYKREFDSATYYGNWLKQTYNVVKQHPHITYFRVIAPDNFCPSELNNLSNIKTIYIDDFKKMFGFS